MFLNAGVRQRLRSPLVRKGIRQVAEELNPQLKAVTATILWQPQAGPQTQAYESEADELFFGGSAGGGKSDLLLGLSVTAHKRTIFFRRESTQFEFVEERAHQLLDKTDARYNGNKMVWRNIPGRRYLKFGSIPHVNSLGKMQGRPYDLICFDEVSDFEESMFDFVIAWARTTDPNQRVRVVACGNPPYNEDGQWVIRRWAAWLDEYHPNPALPGELRYYARVNDKESEVRVDAAKENWYLPIVDADGNHSEVVAPFKQPFAYEGEEYIPKSRTFIPSRLSDNIYLMHNSDYRRQLMNLPEPRRSQMLFGDFKIGQKEDVWRLVKKAWTYGARARWDALRDSKWLEQNRDANSIFALDVAEEGEDKTVLIKMNYNAVQWIESTEETDLMKQANWVYNLMRGSKTAPIGVDAIGVGAGVFSRLKQMGLKAHSIKGSESCWFTDSTGQNQFANLRAGMYWLVREALDPEAGGKLALPPDDDLLREIPVPKWSLTKDSLIILEPKAAIRARLGHSPDRSDALAMALYMQKVSQANKMNIV